MKVQTILIVEDDDALRELVHRILTPNHKVLLASDGQEGLAIFRTHLGDIDLLLVDAGLPYLSGWELAALVEGVRPGIKCLVMSGDSGSQAPLRGQSPRWWFLQKPFSPSELSDTVEQVLELSEHEGRMVAERNGCKSPSTQSVLPPRRLAGQ